MQITLKIYSGLRQYVKNYHQKNGLILTMENGKTIRQLLLDHIEHERTIDAISMITLNDKIIPYQDYCRELHDGDVIKVYPPISGG